VDRDDGLAIAAFIMLFVLAIGAVVWYHGRVEDNCKAKGGYVKWFNDKNDNYLCLSPDGRILG